MIQHFFKFWGKVINKKLPTSFELFLMKKKCIITFPLLGLYFTSFDKRLKIIPSSKQSLVNTIYLNMAHALCSDEASFDGRLQGREQVPSLRLERYRRVEQVLVRVGMRQVRELRQQGGHLKVDVVVTIDESLDEVENAAQKLSLVKMFDFGFRLRRRI